MRKVTAYSSDVRPIYKQASLNDRSEARSGLFFLIASAQLQFSVALILSWSAFNFHFLFRKLNWECFNLLGSFP